MSTTRSILLNAAESTLPTTSTSASSFRGATVVRVLNVDIDPAVLYHLSTASTAANAVVGTVTLGPSGSRSDRIYIFKDPSDCLYSPMGPGSEMRAVPVSFVS